MQKSPISPSDKDVDQTSPATARGDLRRDAILNAASKIFLRDGYHGTSLTDVIAMSGGSKSSLYGYFTNKEGLFEAVIRDQCRSILDTFSALDIESETVEDVLFEIGFNFTRGLCQPNRIRLFRIVMGESLRFPQLGVLFYNAGPVAAYKRLAPYLQAKLCLSSEEAYLSAVQFLDMVKAPIHLQICLNIQGDFSDDAMKKNVKRSVSTFLNGKA